MEEWKEMERDGKRDPVDEKFRKRNLNHRTNIIFSMQINLGLYKQAVMIRA